MKKPLTHKLMNIFVANPDKEFSVTELARRVKSTYRITWNALQRLCKYRAIESKYLWITGAGEPRYYLTESKFWREYLVNRN